MLEAGYPKENIMADQKKSSSIAAVLVIALAVVLIVTLGGKSEAETDDATDIRANTLRLAEEYLAQGEFQRALDLVDKLLIENANDEEARNLRDGVIEAKRIADKEREDAERAEQ